MQKWVPAKFWDDHSDRCPCDGDPELEMATEIRRSGNRVLIEGSAQQIEVLRSDAAFYADRWGPDELPLGLKRSAIATVKALVKEASDTAEAEADERAKYMPYVTVGIKMPDATQLKIKNKLQPRLTPSGWTNGHLIDLAGCPEVVKVAIGKCHGTKKIESIDQSMIDSVLSKMPHATVNIVPVARYVGRVAGHDIDAVVLTNAANSPIVYLDRRYFNYFSVTYKDCEFLTSAAGFGAARIRHEGKLVGAVMPLDIGEETSQFRPKFSIRENTAPKEIIGLQSGENVQREW